MPTFSEYQTTLNALRFKRTVLSKLIEIMDDQFMPDAEGKPKFVLLTEDKVRVPDGAVDDVANDINNWMKALAVEEQKLLSAQVTLTQPPPPPPEATSPTAQETTA